MRRLLVLVVVLLALVPMGAGSQSAPEPPGSPVRLITALETVPFPAPGAGLGIVRPEGVGVLSVVPGGVPSAPVGAMEVVRFTFADGGLPDPQLGGLPDTVAYTVYRDAGSARAALDGMVAHPSSDLGHSVVADPVVSTPVFLQRPLVGMLAATSAVDEVLVQVVADYGGSDAVAAQDAQGLFHAAVAHLRAAELAAVR